MTDFAFDLESRIYLRERDLRKDLRTIRGRGNYLNDGTFDCRPQTLVWGDLRSLALYYAMDNRFDESLGFIHAFGIIIKWYYEMYYQDRKIYPGCVSAAGWDRILFLLITKDRKLISTIGNFFVQAAFDVDDKYTATKAAYYLSQPLSLILTGDLDSAKKRLSLRRSKVDAQYTAICNAMDAIVAYDKEAFRAVILKQIRAWKWRFSGQATPEQYVNHRAVSLICLAEYAWEEKVDCDFNDNIIKNLVCQSDYISYPLPPELFEIPSPDELEKLKNEASAKGKSKKKTESFLSVIFRWLNRKQ